MKLMLLILFQINAAALLYSCFCRLAATSKANTKRPIRWTFTTLGVVAALCVFAPWLSDYEPDSVSTALIGVITLTQIVTSGYWRHGVPRQFSKDHAS